MPDIFPYQPKTTRFARPSLFSKKDIEYNSMSFFPPRKGSSDLLYNVWHKADMSCPLYCCSDISLMLSACTCHSARKELATL